MNSSIPIVKLSRQAGHILPHLTWLPKEVVETINRFPYHSARVFAAGMDYVLSKQKYYTQLDGNDPVYFLSCSSYGYTLNIREFVGFIPNRTVGLLLSVGAIAEQALINNQDLKKVLVPTNQSVQSAIDLYNGQNDVFPDLKEKKNGSHYFEKPSIWERTAIIKQAIDAGASNLAGLKECYLVARYYERVYNRANHCEFDYLGRIDDLDYELPPFPDTVEIKEGDKFIFDKRGVRYEKEWPDILLRDGKYSIVRHLEVPEFHTIATPNTSNYEDIRMAESNVGQMACYILCKRNGKWGAVYSSGVRGLFLIVPYVYDTPEDAAREVNELIDIDNDTRWVTWDDFKGVFTYPDE